MRIRVVLAALALFAAGCDRPASTGETGGADAPQLDAPAPDSEPSRVFAASNDAARNATGELTMSIAMRLPEENADMQEVLTLRGANGLTIEATIFGVVSPATQVQGQTLRALLGIPVEEPQVLVYRVSQETKPASGQGACGADAADYVVVWEPSGPGEPVLKVLGVRGAAPGASEARGCTLLEYRRS
ncbi:MAG: hypothetical protein J0L81_05845 [Caulobacterales bacterium]|jgi:hypothetical protein|nr:hypothetical protein [Caulobacterales bacterium]